MYKLLLVSLQASLFLHIGVGGADSGQPFNKFPLGGVLLVHVEQHLVLRLTRLPQNR